MKKEPSYFAIAKDLIGLQDSPVPPGTITVEGDFGYRVDPLGLAGRRQLSIAVEDDGVVAVVPECEVIYAGCKRVIDENGEEAFEYTYEMKALKPTKE